MKRILLLSLALVALFHTAANAQHPWEMTCSTTSISVQAPNSVAIGETFDIVVTITNTGSDPVYDFKSMVGYIDPGYNNPPAPPSSFLDHFIMLDVHTSRGESDLWYIDRYNDITENYDYFSYIDWDLDEDWKRQWLLPGESATLRITLRSVGVPGTYNFPAAINHFYYDENNYDDVVLDCPNSVALATINITPGTISEPLLIAKPIMAPNFYDCVPIGSSLSAVWQVRNTSDETIWVRLQDVIPGKSFVYLNDILITSAETGTQGFWGIIDYSVDKSTGNGMISTAWPIGLSPGQMLVIVGRMEASKFSQPFEFVSPVKVWLTEENDENLSNTPPNDAVEFFNEPVSVCDPIVTKTTVGTYCNVLEGTIIEYEVSVERIFFDNSTAYLIFKDEHPAGTSYLPFTTVGNAEETYTIYGDPQTTYWVFSDNYVDDLDEDAYEASYEHEHEVFTEPDHDDHIVMRYRVRVDSQPQGDLVNKFSIYSGNRYYNFSYDDDKIVAKGATEGRSMRARRGEVEPPKQATSYNGLTMFYSHLEEAILATKVTHTIKEDCFFIDGYKFNDLNGNGLRDTGEPGVESWMITAQSSEGTYTAVTDADGYYRIDNLPKGVWQVREAYQLGWIQSAPGGEGFYNVSISDQVKSARLDFGNWKFAEISGIKYHDLNGSGTQDDGEPGVEGVLIELRDLSGTVQTTTYTDGAGRYGFAQVPPGHFVVYEEANPKWRQSQPGPAEGGYHYVVTTSGSIHTKKDFGNYEPVTISGSVTQVNNKTTEHDPTVRDFRDLKIQLQRMGPTGDPTPQKTADASEPMLFDLDENGAFEAMGLQPGDWQASVVLAEFWSAVSSNPVDVFVPSGDVAGVQFEVAFDALAAPEVRTGSITGSVFRNTTADHLFDKATDAMVTGQTVRLLGTSERDATVDLQATTGPDGSYTFTELPAGNYVVSLTGTADSLRVGWPWADGHRIVLGEAQHVGSSFSAHDVSHPPAAVNSDLPWKARNWTAYANLWMRIDDDGDGHADRRNFLSGGAELARMSNNGAWPIVVAHTSLQMAGTDSLGRTIRAVSPAGGSLAILGPGAGAPGNGGSSMTPWSQGLDLNLDLADGLWYGPTASSLSNEPAVVAVVDIGQWLSLHTSAEFVAQAGSEPVLRDPMGTPVAKVLSASYVYTPGPDFGLTPKRFDASDDGDGDDDGGGTGSGDGGIGTSDPDDGANLPSDFVLGSAYPNPFNPSTVVPFELAAAGHVQLSVFDVMGRRVSTLVNGTMSAGRHTLAWDAAGLPSGVYVIQLRAGGKVMTAKATLLK